MNPVHDAVAMALQSTRPKPHDRDGGRQWLYDLKAVVRALRSSHNPIAFDAERFVAHTGYTADLAKAWGTELQ